MSIELVPISRGVASVAVNDSGMSIDITLWWVSRGAVLTLVTTLLMSQGYKQYLVTSF